MVMTMPLLTGGGPLGSIMARIGAGRNRPTRGRLPAGTFPRARRHGNRVSKWWVSSIARPDVRETGVVKSYFEAKGFGFIRARGVEYFFHVSDVRPENPKAIIQPGRAVKFEATQTAKGARAVDVVLLSEGAQPGGGPMG